MENSCAEVLFEILVRCSHLKRFLDLSATHPIVGVNQLTLTSKRLLVLDMLLWGQHQTSQHSDWQTGLL